MSNDNSTAPAPALPQEVQKCAEEVGALLDQWLHACAADASNEAIAAIIARHWPRPAPATAELASAKQEVERLKLEQLRLINAASYGSTSAVAASERATQQFTVEQLHGMVADLRADIDRLGAEVAVLEGQLATSEKQLAAAPAQAREAMEDKKRLDLLEELYSTTDDDNPTWKEFLRDVSMHGYRAAIDIARRK